MKDMKKRLVKSSDNKVISGVLGGIAEFFNIDPTIVRVVFVILAVFSRLFPAFLIYVCLALVMPSKHTRTGGYGHDNEYYQKNDPTRRAKRKTAEKVQEDDDWSDF